MQDAQATKSLIIKKMRARDWKAGSLFWQSANKGLLFEIIINKTTRNTIMKIRCNFLLLFKLIAIIIKLSSASFIRWATFTGKCIKYGTTINKKEQQPGCFLVKGAGLNAISKESQLKRQKINAQCLIDKWSLGIVWIHRNWTAPPLFKKHVDKEKTCLWLPLELCLNGKTIWANCVETSSEF